MVVEVEYEEGLWQTLIKNKYLKNDTISSVKHRLDDSPTWANLLKIRQVYPRGGKLKLEMVRKLFFGTTVSLRRGRYARNILFFMSCAMINGSLYMTLTNMHTTLPILTTHTSLSMNKSPTIK